MNVEDGSDRSILKGGVIGSSHPAHKSDVRAADSAIKHLKATKMFKKKKKKLLKSHNDIQANCTFIQKRTTFKNNER